MTIRVRLRSGSLTRNQNREDASDEQLRVSDGAAYDGSLDSWPVLLMTVSDANGVCPDEIDQSHRTT